MKRKFVTPYLKGSHPALPSNTTRLPHETVNKNACHSQKHPGEGVDGLSSQDCGVVIADSVSNKEQIQQTFYFNVLWRKQSSKKNKTWNGDGILKQEGHAYILYDTEGKELGKTINRSYGLLNEGEMIFIGNKEIEIGSSMSATHFLSGRCFVHTSTTSVVSSIAKHPIVKFKTPVLNPVKQETEAVTVAPRHDPLAENALVMKRPASERQGSSFIDVVVDPYLARHLRHHQREGVSFLYECVMHLKDYDGCGAILADEMGLGKTLQTLTLVWTLLKQGYLSSASPAAKRVLIVCPATLIQNWVGEIKKWLGDERLKAFTVDMAIKSGASSSDILREFNLGIRRHPVCILSYERVRTLGNNLAKGQFDLIVCDEGHRLKSGQIKTVQVLRNLTTRRRIILSGTPIQNDLSEFHAMVDFVNPGILGTYATFKRVFEEPIMRSRQPQCSQEDKCLGRERGEELNRLTSLFVLRRTSKVNQKYLVPKNELVLFCRPSAVQMAAYRHLLDSKFFKNIYMQGKMDSSQQLVAISTLRKLVNSPWLIAPSENVASFSCETDDNLIKILENVEMSKWESSGKMFVLHKLLLHLREKFPNDKVVIASNFTSTLDIISDLFQKNEMSFLRLDGSTAQTRRIEYVNRFNSQESQIFAFLLSTKSGGVGLNLIGANRLILFDADWNPSTDLQTMARIWRDGQKSAQVYIYRLVLTGTIEEKIFQRQWVKMGLSDNVIDERGPGTNAFSKEDLRDLFTLHENVECQTHDLLMCECMNQRLGNDPSVLEYDSTFDDVPEDIFAQSDPNPVEDLERLVKIKKIPLRDQKLSATESNLRSSEIAHDWKHVSIKSYPKGLASIDPMLHTVIQNISPVGETVSFVMYKVSSGKQICNS